MVQHKPGFDEITGKHAIILHILTVFQVRYFLDGQQLRTVFTVKQKLVLGKTI